jgi:putative ABC transport system ATP-binding protein
MDAIIQVENLSFSYGVGELKRPVLKEVAVNINIGEIVIMTGPSGSGKTTFLTIIGGLRHADSGSVLVLGRQLIDSNEQTKVINRRQIGYIFQQHNLLKSLTALQNVAMTLELHSGLTEKQRLNRAAAL